MGRLKRILDMKIFCCLFALATSAPAKKGVQESEIICGGEITDDGIITSPGFDEEGHYFNNLNCTWEINIAGVFDFTIYPEVFEVEYDELKIGDESGPEEFSYKFCSSDVAETGSYTTEAYETGKQTQKPWHTFSFDWSTTEKPNEKIKSTPPPSNNLRRRAQDDTILNSSQGSNRSYVGDFTAPVQIKGGNASIRFITDSFVVLRGFKLRIEKGEPEK